MNSDAAAPAEGVFTAMTDSATAAAAATRLTILLMLLEPMTAVDNAHPRAKKLLRLSANLPG
ncbi:hypothetical protein SK803_41220 [Lentzea sp. BCCO 10_0856]|uniref:Uncharacterized protein n=1 Tax=Lentzea miocenica TaxID=3095431 RepID=A0ABU4TF09_9PSEU|nr:hypothetical protein [Lentzea sp. BCCO 10_0856]MDX8036655.1 hypothetical protein [Lentzea sp. BCCO 10_0856]